MHLFITSPEILEKNDRSNSKSQKGQRNNLHKTYDRKKSGNNWFCKKKLSTNPT